MSRYQTDRAYRERQKEAALRAYYANKEYAQRRAKEYRKERLARAELRGALLAGPRSPGRD